MKSMGSVCRGWRPLAKYRSDYINLQAALVVAEDDQRVAEPSPDQATSAVEVSDESTASS